MKTNLLAFFLIFTTIQLFGKGIEPVSKEIKMPPRIIRACCAFGYDIGVAVIPFVSYSDVADPNQIGEHEYLGGKNEGNGIVYTYRGGFIDLAHMRDQADWTAYLYHLIAERKDSDTIHIKLGYEGGPKHLQIFPSKDISNDDAILLAGRIAYDLSVWHEIATWYKVSSVPFVHERYSSFSIEDNYSNMMGVNLGIWALRSNLPYNEAMTMAVKSTLDSLQIALEPNKTFEAMDVVYNQWWTRSYKFPSANVMQKRDMSPYKTDEPALVPGWEPENGSCKLQIPMNMIDGSLLSSYYSLELKLNGKFPVKELFQKNKRHIINQNDFQQLLALVMVDVAKKVKPPRLSRRELKKSK